MASMVWEIAKKDPDFRRLLEAKIKFREVDGMLLADCPVCQGEQTLVLYLSPIDGLNSNFACYCRWEEFTAAVNRRIKVANWGRKCSECGRLLPKGGQLDGVSR